jgi:translation elongation factor P/translation initiation factor 5A
VVALSTSDLKNGMSILVDGAPCKVVEFLHVKPGKGSAFVRSKLKNYLTGNTVDKTFRAGEKLESADVEKSVMQFTYMEGTDYVMMNMSTYEEIRLPEVSGTETEIKIK